MAIGFFTGLARIPAFFTAQRCEAQNPPRVEVFASPSRAKKMGDIEWAKEGGCTVQFSGDEVPLVEVGEQESAFKVVEQSGHWARIRLGKGTGWIYLSKDDDVVPYEDLIVDALAAMTDAWDGRLYAEPGGRFRRLESDRQDVTVTESRRVGGRLWFKVRILSDSPCSVHEPRVDASGWIRAYSADLEPTVLHFPRGC